MFFGLAYVVRIRDGDLLFHLLANFMGHLNWHLNRDFLALHPGHLVAPLLGHRVALLVVAMPVALLGIVSLAFLIIVGLTIFLVILLVVYHVLLVALVFIDRLVGGLIDGVTMSVIMVEDTTAAGTEADDCECKDYR